LERKRKSEGEVEINEGEKRGKKVDIWKKDCEKKAKKYRKRSKEQKQKENRERESNQLNMCVSVYFQFSSSHLFLIEKQIIKVKLFSDVQPL
jgi:predicted DNA-binding antitoxin AbrB/MazE fold protein